MDIGLDLARPILLDGAKYGLAINVDTTENIVRTPKIIRLISLGGNLQQRTQDGRYAVLHDDHDPGGAN